ncbi:unnamed protein product [Oppiella nova]|uniref:Band 7 domain-containing protein n=1 Tax=Oppiella nova TaxID=334625 RepID=A0A7R9LXS2_9ACAR|nr:unnamed protein product [Oppiella nova]CAG2168026.1 unnamed protein product [Oppiella nova]
MKPTTGNPNSNYTSRTNLVDSYELSTLGASSRSRAVTPTPILTPGRRLSVTSSSEDDSLCSTIIGTLMIFAVLLLLMSTFPLSMCFCFIITNDYEKAVLFRNGRLRQVNGMGPGAVFVIPYVDLCYIIDCRTVCYGIPPQKVLTKDSMTIDVDAVVLYRVHNAIAATTKVQSYSKATELLAATSLRNFLGTKTLAQILAESSDINETLKAHLDAATEFWGVCVDRIDIKNVRIPADLQSALSAEAQASREAKANYITAYGEKDASHSLVEAAVKLDDFALQLRYLQTLNTISVNNNDTFIVPIPIELFQFAAH